ncbi:MAG: AraC family transcriptional regulator [Polyangiaceae bacterium]|nr:AraC family transcriptional regulator [Polyangiaceae bacterium]
MAQHRVTELANLIERFTGTDGTHPTAVRDLTLYRATELMDPTPVLYEPALCIIAQGRKRVLLGEEAYYYDPAQFLLVAADVPVEGEIIQASPSQPYLSVRVRLDVGVVAELIAETRKLDALDPTTGRALAVSPVEPALLDAVTRLVALLGAPDDRAVLAPLVLREITYRLLVGAQGARLRQIGAGDGQAQRIVRAVRWLRDHFTEPLRIETLAREVRMSPSALHQHFKSVTAMSPLQYQKRLRLLEARRLMLGEGCDASEACYRVGYESPSHFSREYRRMFGAPPRRDVSSIRREEPPLSA